MTGRIRVREGATATARVIAWFGQVARGVDLRLHPQVAGKAETGVLERLGVGRRAEGVESAPASPSERVGDGETW